MGFIYKIYCKDSNIKDFYIGKTQEIKCRMSQHKSACIRNNTNSYLYKFINLYGGWNNWDYEIIQEVTNKKIDLGDSTMTLSNQVKIDGTWQYISLLNEMSNPNPFFWFYIDKYGC